MDQVFNGFFTDEPEAASFGRTDIYEHDGNLMFETEMPGVKREEINIQVEEGRLIVSGETKREEKIEEESFFRMGRRYGKFQRSFPLPEEATDPKKIQAKFEDGILKVSVPLSRSLKEKEKPIQISVS
jgi:HSP20 family protein